MGAAVGAVLGRSAETRARAEAAGLEDVGSITEVARCDVVFSICPPHAALDVARSADFGGIYVDGLPGGFHRAAAEVYRSR